MKSLALLAATGQLGSGFRAESITEGVDLGVAMIGCDAGTTDFGPGALATGHSQFSRAAVARDLSVLLRESRRGGIPLLIGSAGVAGATKNLEWLVGLVHELAREQSLHFRLAVVHSEIAKEELTTLWREGRTAPLAPNAPLSEQEIEASLHTVAMMGVEPYQVAIEAGAEVVIAGRSSDSAIFAALPLLRGFDAAASWHAGKILECGAAAVTHRVAPDSMLGVICEDTSFEIAPMRPDYRCTPQSIASHTLYENSDPFRLVEPSGILDTEASLYEAVDDRRVRVSGSRFVPAARYSVKLEGVRLAGYSTVLLGGVRDPLIIGQLDSWLAQLDLAIRERLSQTIGTAAEFEIVTRVYGRDATMGPLEPSPVVEGHEVGILWEVISPEQELSHSIASSLSHMAVHNPIPEWHGLISGVAFPFSPMEIDRGPVYEFHLNHVAYPQTPTSLFPIDYEDL